MGSNTVHLNVVTARTALAVLLLSGPTLRPA